MTSSDDDLRKLLARELKAEAARFTPAEDGLSRIRGRLRSRPSFALWGGLRVDAERYGYRLRYVAAEALAWLFSLARRGWQVPSGRFKTTPATQVTAAPDALAAGGVSAGVRHFGAGAVSGLRATYQRVGTLGLRLVVAFAAVCLFAGTAFAVPGFRNAIGSIASSSSGGTGTGGGTGNGTGGGTGNGTGGGTGNGTGGATGNGTGGGTGNGTGNGTGQQPPGAPRVAPGPGGKGKYTAGPSPTSTCVNPTKTVPKASPTTPGIVVPVPSVTPTVPRRGPRRASHRPRCDAGAHWLGQPDAERHHAGFRQPRGWRARARRPRARTSRPSRAPARPRRRLLQRSRPPPQRPSCGPGRLRRRTRCGHPSGRARSPGTAAPTGTSSGKSKSVKATAPSTTKPSTTGPSTTGPSTTGPSTTGPSTTAGHHQPQGRALPPRAPGARTPPAVLRRPARATRRIRPSAHPATGGSSRQLTGQRGGSGRQLTRQRGGLRAPPSPPRELLTAR